MNETRDTHGGLWFFYADSAEFPFVYSFYRITSMTTGLKLTEN